MVIGCTSNGKKSVQQDIYLPREISRFHASALDKSYKKDGKSRTRPANEDIDEYARGLFKDFSPLKEESIAQPNVQLRSIGSSQSMELCTQLTLKTSTNHGGRIHYVDHRMESAHASSSSNPVPLSGSPKPESVDKLHFERGIVDCSSRSSPPNDSPVLRWIIARLEDWQDHLNRLPTASTASQHLNNITTSLLHLKDEVKLIRYSLLNHTVEEADHAGLTYADDCGLENDSRMMSSNLIVHVSSNTFLFCFEQLCGYMKQLPAWIMGSVHHDSVIFWHYEEDDEGCLLEKPNACAVLPRTDISRLSYAECKKFVNIVNKVEGSQVFHVQTIVVRTPDGSTDRSDSE